MGGETEQHESGWTVDTLKLFLEAEIEALDRLIGVVQQDSKNALTLALTANDKRLDLLNEFRKQSEDRDSRFLTKEVHEAFVERFNEYKEANDKRSNLRDGQNKGVTFSTKVVVGAISLIGTILGIMIVVLNLLTTH